MWLNKELGKNFFDINEEYSMISPFKELIESVGKRRASNIMWSIYLVYYPSSLYYLKYGEDEQARIKAVNKEFNTRDSIVNFADYSDIIKHFYELIPPSIKALLQWELALKEYDKYIDGLTFERDFKKKVDGLAEKKKLWDLFIAAKKDYEDDSRDISANRGNYQGSMIEKGILK